MAFVPTNINNCFLWFAVSNITGVSDGQSVSRFADMSGSGNDLVQMSVPAAIYKSNILNGLPVIQISGGILSTTGVNISNSFSISGFTLYSVYSTPIWKTEQCVASLEDDVAAQVQRTFLMGLNADPAQYASITHVVASGWHRSWSKNTAASNIIIPSSTSAASAGTAIQPADINSFVVRGERWAQSPGKPNVYFTFNDSLNVIQPSADANAYISLNAVNTNFYLGFSLINSGLSLVGKGTFTGRIAEFIGYNRRISDIEDIQILNYLTTKYNLGNQGGMPLFIFEGGGQSGVYGDIPLYTIASPSSTLNQIPLFTESTSTVNSGIKLFLDSASTSTPSGIKLFISGVPPISSGNIPLFLNCAVTIPGSIPLFIANTLTTSSGITLYINPFDTGTLSTTLFIANILSASSTMPLFISNSLSTFDSIALYTSGVFQTQSGIPLYITAGIAQSRIPLTTIGAFIVNSGMPLYIPSAANASGNFPIFLYADSSTGVMLPLFSLGGTYPQKSNNIPLTIYCNTPSGFPSTGGAVYSQIPLYMRASPSSTNAPLPLFLEVIPEPLPSAVLPLFIGYDPPIGGTGTSNSIPLYLGNNVLVSQNQTKLFIRGLGDLIGGLFSEESLPLYLDVGFGGQLPFFMQGIGTVSGGIPLYMSGVLSSSQNVPLFIRGTATTGTMPLFISGPNSVMSGISLYVAGFPSTGNITTLYLGGF